MSDEYLVVRTPQLGRREERGIVYQGKAAAYSLPDTRSRLYNEDTVEGKQS